MNYRTLLPGNVPMNPYTLQKILVPVDMSESSLTALETAVHFAQKHGAVLQILNITETSFFTYKTGSNPNLSNRTNPAVLQALTGAIQYANDLNPDLLHTEGNVV